MPAKLNIKNLKKFLLEIAVKRKRPVLVSGMPGVGKSVGFVELVAELNQLMQAGAFEGTWLAKFKRAILVDIRLNLYDSVDFRGIPSIEKGKAGSLTVWNIPATVPYVGNPRFSPDDLILMALDELGSASPSVFPVAMQMINEGGVGENKLGDNVVIVSATNRVSDRGTSVLLPTTINNRFIHAEAIPDRQAWCDWWLDQGGTPVAVAFYEFRKELFCDFDPADRDKVAYASPRTNEFAWRLFMDEDLDATTKSAAIAGAVGDGIAAEIMAFEQVWKKVLKTRDIVKDPEGVKLPDEESMLYATAVSVSGDMCKSNVAQLDKFLKRLPAIYQTLAWTLALRRTDNTKDDLSATNAAIDYCKRLKDVF